MSGVSVRVFLLPATLMLMPGLAIAGPWPRAEGDVFLSFSVERDRFGDAYAGIYGEYGMSARQTLGFQLGYSREEISALFWLQRAFERGPDRWSLWSGGGGFRRDGRVLPLAVIGAAWGRGLDKVPLLEGIPGGGWLAVEAQVKLAGEMTGADRIEELAAEDAGSLDYLTPTRTTKGEITLGWNATETIAVINQLRLEDRRDTGFSSKWAGSVVYDLRGLGKLELGVVVPISGEGEAAIKLGTWLEF